MGGGGGMGRCGGAELPLPPPRSIPSRQWHHAHRGAALGTAHRRCSGHRCLHLPVSGWGGLGYGRRGDGGRHGENTALTPSPLCLQPCEVQPAAAHSPHGPPAPQLAAPRCYPAFAAAPGFWGGSQWRKQPPAACQRCLGGGVCIPPPGTMPPTWPEPPGTGGDVCTGC